jgi:hypothetical protein
MKHIRFAQTGVILVVLATAFSSFAKPSTEDFNSMIEENQATQKVLSQKLQKQLKTEKLSKEEQKPNFQKVGEDVLGRNSTENVAVASGDSGKTTAQKSHRGDLEKKNFRRLSQELKDIK